MLLRVRGLLAASAVVSNAGFGMRPRDSSSIQCCPRRHSSTLGSAASGPHASEPSLFHALDSSEQEQRERERLVDAREVLFATAGSSDHRPRMAAAEAFDVARAALPRPPNFACVFVTLDYSAMLDAPEVIWANLCQANGVSPNSSAAARGAAKMPNLVGGCVNHQRIGGGNFIQVMLGCIPDLEMDVFSFDGVPTKDVLQEASSRPPLVACIANVDAKLMLQHEAILSSHIASLALAVRGDSATPHPPPLFGSVLPPVGNAGSPASSRKKSVSRDELEESIFFLNDRVYRGSAAGAVLRSRLLRAHQRSIVPSIAVRSSVVCTHVKLRLDPLTKAVTACIGQFDGMPATEYIKQIYTTENGLRDTAKVFLGLSTTASGGGGSTAPQRGPVVLPLTFQADATEADAISCLLPHGVSLAEGDTVSFVVDDPELDTEAGAVELLALQKELSPVACAKDITVAREGRKSVVVSSCGAIHFSNRHMNVMAERSDVVSLGLGNTAALTSAPSVLQRMVGSSIANTGVYTPGQIVSIGKQHTYISARASSYTLLEGLK